MITKNSVIEIQNLIVNHNDNLLSRSQQPLSLSIAITSKTTKNMQKKTTWEGVEMII